MLDVVGAGIDQRDYTSKVDRDLQQPPMATLPCFATSAPLGEGGFSDFGNPHRHPISPVAVIEITAASIVYRAHWRMNNTKPILGADCPACNSFVSALPLRGKHSRWKCYMRCVCGVFFFTEKTYTRSDTEEVHIPKRTHSLAYSE